MALLIKYKPADTGDRPIMPCDSSNPYWVSPSIFITGGVDAGTVSVGQTVILNVRLWNVGEAATTKVKVQVWVSDYTTLPDPAFSALTLQTGITTATGTALSVPAGVNQPGKAVACDPQWTVTQGQATQFNGHVCLVANCFLDDGSEGTEGSPGTNPFLVGPNSVDFCSNPRHAQRNIAIEAAQGDPGQGGRVNIHINAVNPDPEHERPIRLQMTHAVGKLALTPVEIEHIRSGKFRNLKPVVSRFKVANFGMITYLNEPSQPIEVRGKPAHEARFDLGPRKKAPIQVFAELNPKEKVGNLHAFDITQLNERGRTIGGARLLVIVAPPEKK